MPDILTISLYSLLILQLPIVFFVSVLTFQAWKTTHIHSFLWLSIGFSVNLFYISFQTAFELLSMFSVYENKALAIGLTSALSILGIAVFFHSVVAKRTIQSLPYTEHRSAHVPSVVAFIDGQSSIKLAAYVLFALLILCYSTGIIPAENALARVLDKVSLTLSCITLLLLAINLFAEGQRFNIGGYFVVGFVLWAIVQFNQGESRSHQIVGFATSLLAKGILLLGFSRYFVQYARMAIIAEGSAIRAEESKIQSDKITAVYVDVLRTLFHEISNPLAALRASVETLASPEAGIPRAMRTLVLSIENNFERAQAIIRVAMQTYYSKFKESDGKMEYNEVLPENASTIQINTYIEFAIKAFERSKGIKMIEPYYGSKCSVTCSPWELMQIFTNLFKNAYEATIEGARPKIIVRTYTMRGESEGNPIREVVCEVEDFASGIADDIQHKIWEPGFSTKSTSDEHIVRGQGLAVVRTILSKLHGRIEVESPVRETTGALHNGTKFTLYLPYAHRQNIE